jgi:hypothetical protein
MQPGNGAVEGIPHQKKLTGRFQDAVHLAQRIYIGHPMKGLGDEDGICDWMDIMDHTSHPSFLTLNLALTRCEEVSTSPSHPHP